jgi:hypothetical protein
MSSRILRLLASCRDGRYIESMKLRFTPAIISLLASRALGLLLRRART